MKIVELQKVSPAKIGHIDENGVKPKKHERYTAEYLVLYGFNVVFIVPSNAYKTKNADFLLNGSIWETKSPTGDGKNNIKRQFDDASKQADKLVLDLRRTKLPAEKAERQAKSHFQGVMNLKRLLLITKDGKVLDIRR